MYDLSPEQNNCNQHSHQDFGSGDTNLHTNQIFGTVARQQPELGQTSWCDM